MPNQHWLYSSVHKTWKNEHTGDVMGLEEFHEDANVHTWVKDMETPNLTWAIEYCNENHNDQLHANTVVRGNADPTNGALPDELHTGHLH